MYTTPASPRAWRLGRGERIGLGLGFCFILAFGINLEYRTALRRIPMTDLGVFATAAWAVRSGDNLYTVCDWHGWHYQYPPTLAILFTPLAQPVPKRPSTLSPGEKRTEMNTPWGYEIESHRHFYGLHEQNSRFFSIVAVWYLFSIALIARRLLGKHPMAADGPFP